MRSIQIHWEDDLYNDSRIHFVVDFINNHPLKPEGISVGSGTNSDNPIIVHYGDGTGSQIPAQNALFNKNKTVHKEFNSKAFVYNETKVYGVSTGATSNTHFYKDGKFGFDLLETIFFHISRYEEYYAEDTDKGYTNCLEETKQFMVENNIYQVPVVDVLVASFFESILSIKIQNKSTYSISHDIDLLWRFKPSYKIVRNIIADIYHGRGFGKIKRGVSFFLKMKREKLKDPYDVFHFLFRSENHWKGKVLYLMVGGETKYDNKYKLDDPKVDSIIQEARNKGYSIGLHPSYNCLNKPKLYLSEIKKLENKIQEKVINNRQHVLRWEWQETPEILSSNTISQDSTMGFTRRLGFRSGTGYPYHMYNFKTESKFPWVELPMSFMESSAIHFASATKKSISEVMSSFLEQNKYNTHIEMNVHNSNFDPTLLYGEELVHFYTKTLNEIIE